LNGARRRIRIGIALTAAGVLGALLALRFAQTDETLMRILAVGGGLLVTLLFVTYRALERIAAAAKANPIPPQPHTDDKDER
jgi:hypothetical protein